MRKSLSTLLAILVCSIPALAQMGGGAGPGGGSFDNGMEKLFSATPVFSANMKTSMNGPNGPMTVSTKMYFDHNNSRTEMNMSDVKGGNLPPAAVSQMQSLGMDEIVMITPADKKSIYMIYPKIHSYVAMPINSSDPNQDFSLQITKLGIDTVDGHPCVKNQVTVTNAVQTQEFTAWNATDLKNFPIQIQQSQQGVSATINFENVSFGGVSSSMFHPPSDYTKYDSMQSLMQTVVMKNQPGGAGGAPSPSVTPSPNQ